MFYAAVGVRPDRQIFIEMTMPNFTQRERVREAIDQMGVRGEVPASTFMLAQNVPGIDHILIVVMPCAEDSEAMAQSLLTAVAMELGVRVARGADMSDQAYGDYELMARRARASDN